MMTKATAFCIKARAGIEEARERAARGREAKVCIWGERVRERERESARARDSERELWEGDVALEREGAVRGRRRPLQAGNRHRPVRDNRNRW
eukprot:1260910-Pleurochrysis_carterae.AAC.2